MIIRLNKEKSLVGMERGRSHLEVHKYRIIISKSNVSLHVAIWNINNDLIVNGLRLVKRTSLTTEGGDRLVRDTWGNACLRIYLTSLFLHLNECHYLIQKCKYMTERFFLIAWPSAMVNITIKWFCFTMYFQYPLEFTPFFWKYEWECTY